MCGGAYEVSSDNGKCTVMLTSVRFYILKGTHNAIRAISIEHLTPVIPIVTASLPYRGEGFPEGRMRLPGGVSACPESLH